MGPKRVGRPGQASYLVARHAALIRNADAYKRLPGQQCSERRGLTGHRVVVEKLSNAAQRRPDDIHGVAVPECVMAFEHQGAGPRCWMRVGDTVGGAVAQGTSRPPSLPPSE